MKRHLHEGAVEEEKNYDTAKCLLLFSRAITAGALSPARGYECKTCNRKFASFQALGGHRASHKKLRFDDDDERDKNKGGKPRGHECSVCGLEFAIDQALGGHMRRHRNAPSVPKVQGGHDKKAPFFFDLNLPPMEDYTTLVLT